MPAIALMGATGKMGRALVRAVSERSELRISGALATRESAHLGEDIGVLSGFAALGVKVKSDIDAALKGADVAIDFALAGNVEERARAVAAAGCAWVLGTTGLSARQEEAVGAAAGRVPVLASPNMSVAVHLLMKLVDTAARALPTDYDIEIFEAHHRDKIDAPSGTARRLGEVAAAARGARVTASAELKRASTAGPRKAGSIGISVARGGDIVGEHRVTFAGPGEQLVLEHRANDRMAFARGAVAAALWLAGRPAGRYEMGDVIS
jgi:4-hydroxy-tetrahydrodipicolinate reductase